MAQGKSWASVEGGAEDLLLRPFVLAVSFLENGPEWLLKVIMR